jgi:hypothetical protein
MNPYDEVLYEGHPFAQTHPDRLATMARLFGMEAAPVERCRLLELGCGDGGNLIPMAYTLAGSEFVGLDAGERGIAKGRGLALALGLSNLQLRALDLMEADADLGTFDYIVAHGVYSWVPPAVQERILAICRDRLSRHGVAYISYAAYPGGHLRTMISEMLQYHARRFPEPARQIEQARAFLTFLAQREPDDGCTLMLREEVETVAARRPATLYHDELAAHSAPVYFHQFAASAGRHGLQYLGEADFFEMQDCVLPAEASGMLRRLAKDLIDLEQYMDLLKCRRFRQTLLCHAGLKLDRAVRSEQMRAFHVSASSRAQREAPPKLPTDHPVALAAVAAANEAWPAALSFEKLLGEVERRAGAFAEVDALLADVVLACFAGGLFQLHVRPPKFAACAGERPRASALARLQAGSGEYVTNLCHCPVRLEGEWSRLLLKLADGSRDRAALLADLRAAAGPAAGKIGQEDFDRSLQGLAACALLEA